MEPLLGGSSVLFEWVLRSTFQASILICLILVVKLLVGSKMPASWHHFLWLLVVARMLMPWTVSSRLSVFNVFNSIHVQPEGGSASPYATETRSDTASNFGPEGRIGSNLVISNADETIRTVNVVSPDEGTYAAAAPLPRPQEDRLSGNALGATNVTASVKPRNCKHITWNLEKVLSLVWLAGFAGLGAYICVSNLRLWRTVRRERLITDQRILDLLEDCRAKMGIRTHLGVVQTDKVSSPVLFGLFRPRLLLPGVTTRMLSLEELRHVFLHELAHVKRRDIFFGWLASALLVVHWFNPLVWYAFYRMRLDRELACDQSALAAMDTEPPKQYGRTIVSLLERSSPVCYLPGTVGILENKVQLERRIAMIAKFTRESKKWTLPAVLIILLLVFVGLTDARPREPGGGSVTDRVPTELKDNLLLYYSFQQDTGKKVTDISGAGRSGQVHGATYQQDDLLGGAMSFDGQDDFISVPDVRLEDFSFSAWVKTPLTQGTANNRFIFTLDDGLHYYALQGNVGGALSIVSDGQEINEYEWQFGNNAWVHLTLTHEDGSFKLYKDGELTEAASLASNSVAGTFCIGGTPRQRGGCWQGMIDEVALFNRALSEQEVQRLYAMTGREKGLGGQAETPVPYPATDEPRTRPLFALYAAIGDIRDLENSPVEGFGLGDEPILTNEDIVEYDWNTHTLQLRPGSARRLHREYIRRAVTPFVVMANGQRCYLGAFVSPISSYLPQVPTIQLHLSLDSPKYTIRASGNQTDDPRSDPRMREASSRRVCLANRQARPKRQPCR